MSVRTSAPLIQNLKENSHRNATDTKPKKKFAQENH